MIARNFSTGMAKLRLVEKSAREGKVIQLPQVPQASMFQVHCMPLSSRLIWGKNLRSVWCRVLLQPLLLLWIGPLLELEILREVLGNVHFEAWILTYASVDRVSSSATLEGNKDDSTHNWNEVEREVHDVANESRRSELLKW